MWLNMIQVNCNKPHSTLTSLPSILSCSHSLLHRDFFFPQFYISLLFLHFCCSSNMATYTLELWQNLGVLNRNGNWQNLGVLNIWRCIWGFGRASIMLKGELAVWLWYNLKDKCYSDSKIPNPNYLLFASTLWFLWKRDAAVFLMISSAFLFGQILSSKGIV
ncbi:hypothetical protein ACOSQ2_004195 [Xanthoceras sorbifolium]